MFRANIALTPSKSDLRKAAKLSFFDWVRTRLGCLLPIGLQEDHGEAEVVC